MRIGIVKERHPGERRVAASADTVKRYVQMGAEVLVETGAGVDAAVTDAAYEAAGARITKTAKEALADADVVLKVRKPALDETIGRAHVGTPVNNSHPVGRPP